MAGDYSPQKDPIDCSDRCGAPGRKKWGPAGPPGKETERTAKAVRGYLPPVVCDAGVAVVFHQVPPGP